MDKESRYYTVVRRYHVHHQRLVVLALGLSAALVIGVGFWLGRAAAYSGLGVDPARYRAQAAQLETAQARAEGLEQELDLVSTRHQVDRDALELVRRELARQKEQIAGLEEGIRFYRSLMAPGEIAEGFSLRQVELVAREQPGRYGFRIVAQQEASEHSLLEGELYAEVTGLEDGEPVTLGLARLSGDLASNIVPLRFRYFQSIEGNLQLPVGFQPDSISVVATIKSPRMAEASEKFPWKVQKHFTRGVR